MACVVNCVFALVGGSATDSPTLEASGEDGSGEIRAGIDASCGGKNKQNHPHYL